MTTIPIGIAGLSKRGLHWINLIQKIPGFRITALCDLYQGPIDAAREHVEHPQDTACFRRFEEFLQFDGMDAVALVVRSPDQGAMAAQAMEAGKHVHAEVPAAHRIEDCWRIVLAQERSGKVYQLAEQLRYAGYVEEWRRLVADGSLGEITYAEGQYLHYYLRCMFRDPSTGALFGPDQLAQYPDAEPTWVNLMPPIHYIVHDISPLLKGMSTESPGKVHPEIQQPDMQVAQMKTAKGALLRLLVSFVQPHPEKDMHWLQVIGTRGSVEWRRSHADKSRMWLAGRDMEDKKEMDWDFQRADEPEEARGTGHWNLDYYVHTAFRDAVLENKPQELDVYSAMETAAPGIIAAESIVQDSKKLPVPDFRPGSQRAKGQPPK